MPTPAKSEESAAPAVDATLPTVSVQEALGLPGPMDFVAELKNLSAAPDVAPAGTHDSVTGAPPEEPVEKPAPAKPAETPVAKPVEKPAPAKPADKGKPAPVVAEPAKAAPNAPAVPAVPVVPAKIKVGGKEYTQEELETELKHAREPAPVAPAPAPKAPTPEEQAAEAAKTQQDEDAWVAENSKYATAPLDEANLDKILAGGAEAVKAFQEMRKRDIAAAVLHARKSVYADLNPILQRLTEGQKPLEEFVSSAETDRAVAEFNGIYPHLAERTVVVDSCAKALLDSRPGDVAKMTRTQFFAEVADMAEKFIEHVKPTKIRIGDKDYTPEELQSIIAGQGTPIPAPAEAAVPAKPAPAAAPAVKSAKGGPRPLGPNSPGGVAGGAKGKSAVADLLP